MENIFRVILLLSFMGAGLTAILLILKPFASRHISAGWQCRIWFIVLASMILPVYKFIPEKPAERIVFSVSAGYNTREIVTVTIWTYINQHMNFLSVIWIVGMMTYLAVVMGSYFIYLFKKKRKSIEIENDFVFEKVKNEMNIKRNIKLRVSNGNVSPMLVGVIRPVVYIPSKEIADDNMRMIFMHELTHYKNKDLVIKWFSVFINAVHWFNPFAYLLCANVTEACEVFCDMTVTENMTDKDRKLYMNTILDLAK